MKRETWSSKIGFVFAAAGSAIGLGTIWRFPYLVGYHGGAIFILVFLLCLIVVGLSALLSEVLIGRRTTLSPAGAFEQLGRAPVWGWLGKLTIVTGFIVSAFYSAVSSWILGYLFESVVGNLSYLTTAEEVIAYHESLMGDPWWGLSFHLLFLFLSWVILISGVRGGIERANKFFLPFLYLVLLYLVFIGLSYEKAWEGLQFLFIPDWSEVTPLLVLMALGQAFFSLSIGQGTMVTYGSYLQRKDNALSACLSVTLMDIVASILTAMAIFLIVFAQGLETDAGPPLLFHTLPLVFSNMTGGAFLAILFFLLVFVAAITSQISAMEPTIAFLVDRFSFTRRKAVTLCTSGVFMLGVPCSLSTSVLSQVTFFELNPLEFMLFVGSNILVPLGGLLAVLLVGWRWGIKPALQELYHGTSKRVQQSTIFKFIFTAGVKYVAPLLIIIVLLNALGLF